MTSKINTGPDMVDMAFSLTGEYLPPNYRPLLWRALLTTLPWLAHEPGVGMVPFRWLTGETRYWLPKRARLAIRMPERCTSNAQALEGKRIEIGPDSFLFLGESEVRQLNGYPSIHAHMVVTDAENEEQFSQYLENHLAEIEIGPHQWICGKFSTLDSEQGILKGHSLVIHHLRMDQSLYLLNTGIGKARHLGCGLFTPFKRIPNLE